MKADEDRLIRDLEAMVRIPSVNPYDELSSPGKREEDMAAWLLTAMEEIGLETGRDEITRGRPNVWGRLRGAEDGPVLMLAGHMDTVGVENYEGAPFAAERRGSRIHGRGAVDMKGALASMLETARQAKALKLKGDLLLMFVIDEEHQMIGSVAAGERGPKADFCIVCEPSLLAVAPAHKGQSVFPIHVEGVGAHSSRPELGVNAIASAARLIDAIGEYDRELGQRQAHPLLGHARATPVMISGGESHSAVPARVTVYMDRRTLPAEAPELVFAEVEAMVKAAGVVATVSPPSPVSGGIDTPTDAPIARAALKAAAAHGQAEPVAFPGGTDAPNFLCPAVICGPGDLALAHTVDEYIEINQMSMAVDLYLEVVRDLLRGSE